METDLQGKSASRCGVDLTTTNVKALQLLEYLVKNGSERVVDDARSHIHTLKMLRNFHYIDEKGKDEGINGTNLYTLLGGFPTNVLSQQFAIDPKSLWNF